jgi:hypothetical protein
MIINDYYCNLLYILSYINFSGTQFRSAMSRNAVIKNANVVMIRKRIVRLGDQGVPTNENSKYQYAYIHYFARVDRLFNDENVTFAAVSILREEAVPRQPSKSICIMDYESNCRKLEQSPINETNIEYVNVVNIYRNVIRLVYANANKQLNMDWCIFLVDNRRSVDVDPERVEISLPLFTPEAMSSSQRSLQPLTVDTQSTPLKSRFKSTTVAALPVQPKIQHTKSRRKRTEDVFPAIQLQPQPDISMDIDFRWPLIPANFR